MNRWMRWASLIVTDRRWAAPISAVAIGFGLFIGVAIGPGAAGTLATGAAQVIEIPALAGGGAAGGGGGDGGGGSTTALAAPAGSAAGGGGGAGATSSALPSFAPLVPSSPAPIASSPPPGQIPSSPAPSPTDGSSSPGQETLSGTVLHVNPAAGSYAIVEAGGTLDAVHSSKLPGPGTKVSAPVRPLANGTFAEAGTRTKSGQRTRATFSGTVTFLDPSAGAPAYAISKRGVSVLVHVHPDPTGAAPSLPALGVYASVTVDIEKPQPPASTSASPDPAATPSDPAQLPVSPPVDPAPATAPAPPGCAPDPSQPPPGAIAPEAILWQRQLNANGAPFTYSDFEGIVEAICAESGQLLVSADDTHEDAKDLVFAVPQGIDLTKVTVGQSVVLMADIGADGSLSLTALASDERTKGADDLKAAQGALAPSKSK